MDRNLFTKNFTLLVLGQICSLFGNLILRFALSMYVLEVTGSAAVFAGILAAAAVPTILLSPFGGILADRANRRNIMVTLDTLTGTSVLLATLLFSNDNAIAVISVLLVMLSILGAFETPTVQACVPQMQTGDNIIKGNAVVNQIAAVAYLITPILGSVLYTAFGLRPVMATSIICFFLTAAFECFIRLEYIPYDSREGILAILKHDFTVSIKFMWREQPNLLKMLLLIALVSFFVQGTAMVGLPYIVRTVLGLSAGYYGAAESVLGLAAVIGSIAAGFLIGKLKIRRLALLLASLGAFLLPAGIVFLSSAGAVTRYAVTAASFCGMQLAATVFSIFAVSIIQQNTPNHLIGKIMAYTSTITICIQPLGQLLYGFLFDRFRDSVYLVLIPTGLIICMIGLSANGFFKAMDT